MANLFLMADMGGTNIRFALFDGQDIVALTHYKCANFSSFAEAIDAYRKTASFWPKTFVLAVPGPVGKEEYSFVNNPWRFSLTALTEQFGFEKIHVVNDFQAAAMAVPFLNAQDIVHVGGEEKIISDAPRLIMGAGTGLGCGILIPEQNGLYRSLASEGGHIGFSPATPQEEKIKQFILDKVGRASAERVVSGQGLQNIYNALSGHFKASEAIVEMALTGDDLACESILQMFALWGDIAGDLALTLLARGGVYLTGGMVQIAGISDLFTRSDFNARFIAKGRYHNLMNSIPIYLIIRHDTAFLGLKAIGLQA